MAIKKSFIRGINVILAALLVLLGFSNCEPKLEYGVPNADYTIKGTIVDKADSKPIEGIRIGFARSYPGPATMYGVIPQHYRNFSADTTDVLGQYKLSDHFAIGEIQDNMLPVYLQDIDGAENGLYNDTVLNIDFENAKRTGKTKNWYDGEYTVDVNIELTRKKEGNE